MATLTNSHELVPAGRFSSLAAWERIPIAGRRGAGFAASLVLHGGLVAAVILLPLVYYDALPTAAGREARAFFAEPLALVPPPPPPPPPPAGARRMVRRAAPSPPPLDTAKLVAPVEIPDVLPVPEASLDLGLGIEGGVPGGVEGGVPGGVVGGIVGGLPPAPPPPRPRKVVRVGGNIVAPELIRRVDPAYPPLALEARVEGVVILEAQVDTRGRVAAVKVLRGRPLLDEPALAAVRQWRYRPLLLNGEPTDFVLTVTVMFQLKN